jgi:hypothetical protein
MNGIPAINALNRLLLDLVWFVPLFCIGLPLFIYCVIQLAYWLCFGRRKPKRDEIATEELVIHMYVGPCLSESDIAEIESENVKSEENEAWTL